MTPRLLVVAHHCNPTWGSEPRIGWSWAKALEQQTPIEIVTHVRNREALRQHGDLHSPIHYVDTEKLANRVRKLNDMTWGTGSFTNRMLLDTLCQLAFDREACRIARRRITAGAIDAIQRVSPTSPRYPTRLGTLGVPFVLGPVNGGLQTAPGFDEIDRAERTRWLSLRGFDRLLDPLRTTVRKAGIALAANAHTETLLRGRGAGHVVRMSENGIWTDRFQVRTPRQHAGLRLLFVGRLVPLKGATYLLRALARLPEDVTLDIVGDGPQRTELEQLSHQLGVASRTSFHGRVPVESVAEVMRRHDALCLPSVRESGGGVILEAAACALPAIVLDHGGPAELVNDFTGYRLSACNGNQLVDGLVKAANQLRTAPERCIEMGIAAHQNVCANYTWSHKARTLLAALEACSGMSPLAVRHAS